MKIQRLVAFCLLAVLLLPALAACDLFHTHTYQYTVEKDATCTEKGKLRLLCTDCGALEYADLEMSAHDYVGGICRNCSALGEEERRLTKIQLPANSNTEAAWSLAEVHALTADFGYKGSYEKFASSLSGSALFDGYIDSLGLFHVTVSCTLDGEAVVVPLALSVERFNVTNPSPSMGKILRVDIVENEMLITYGSGDRCSAGKFVGGTLGNITGFGLSAQSELVILYSNGMVAFAGTIG